MREIKFRFWFPGLKVMHSWENMKDGFGEHEDGLEIFEESDHWKPMQFTGLKDKNGKEIYEGDIIVLDDVDSLVNETFVGEVVFKAPYFTTYVPIINSHAAFATTSEVIGNIYENPDLLAL